MTTYIQKQFKRARELSAPTDIFVMKIRGPVGQTNWINISQAELNEIQAILERDPIMQSQRYAIHLKSLLQNLPTG